LRLRSLRNSIHRLNHALDRRVPCKGPPPSPPRPEAQEPPDNRMKSALRDPESMDHRPALEVRFPPASEPGEVRGMLHRPRGPTVAGLVVTHGRSGDLRNRLVRRIAETAAEIGLLALRMNFRYVDEKGRASRDLRREEDELRGAVRFLRKDMGDHPIFIAGTSMGARVCARASSDPDVAGVITLG